MGIERFLYIIIFMAWMGTLDARPISYPGGSTVMAHSDTLRNTFFYHYSPSYKYSVGIQSVKDKVLDEEYASLRLTYLVNRKNTVTSQRNLYLQAGIAYTDNYFYGIHGDWETRRLFLGLGYRQNYNTQRDFSEQYIQLGITPYIGDYGDFHTWLMVKSKRNTITRVWETYPFIKFFMRNALFEVGYSDQSNWDAHLMYQF